MKRILCVMLALMLLLSACGKKEQGETEATTAPEQTGAAVEVTLPQWAEEAAMEVDGRAISQTWLVYYYKDAVSGFYNQAMSTVASYAQYLGNSDYAQLISMLYGLDITKPLSEQNVGEDQTWADFFVESVVTAARRDAGMTRQAEAAGFVLDAQTQASVDALADNIATHATTYGFADTDSYLRATYGDCAALDSYLEYYNYRIYADAYYQQENAAFAQKEFTQQERQDYDAENGEAFNSFTFTVAFVSEQEDQTLIEELMKGAVVDGLSVSAGQLGLTPQEGKRVMGPNIAEQFRAWVTDSARQEFDVATIATEEGAQTPGTYVVQFLARHDNAQPMANVRHLLVKFETDSTGAQVAGTKEACLSKANSLLETWRTGEATEESFVELVKQYSEDGNASTGGMYEAINPGTSFVEPFLNWCIDENRQPGDVDIVETTYGYHIMYFSSHTQELYRDQLITEAMRAEAQNQWYTQTLEQVSVSDPDTTHLPLDMVLAEGEN